MHVPSIATVFSLLDSYWAISFNNRTPPMDEYIQGSQAECLGGGLGQCPGGTVVITYCPGVILLVS